MRHIGGAMGPFGCVVGQYRPWGSLSHFGVSWGTLGVFRVCWGSCGAVGVQGSREALSGAVGSGRVEAPWGRLGTAGLSGAAWVVWESKGGLGWAKGAAPLGELWAVGEARGEYEGVHRGQVHWKG